MSLVSRKEFADLCGDTDVKTLNVNIGRGKVIVSGDKGNSTIDTENPINANYLKQRKLINGQKREVQQIIARIPQNPNKKTGSKADSEDDNEMPDMLQPEILKAFNNADDTGASGMGKWLLMKMKGDAELVTLKVEREQLLLDKAAGKLLPIDLVHATQARYNKSIFVSFENGIENIATKFCQIMAGGDITLFTRVMEDCRALLHRCIQDAGKLADEDIEKLINDYTETKKL